MFACGASDPFCSLKTVGRDNAFDHPLGFVNPVYVVGRVHFDVHLANTFVHAEGDCVGVGVGGKGVDDVGKGAGGGPPLPRMCRWH